MISKDNRWKNLFLLGVGLAAGAAFCMKWMESDMYVNGERFTIMGLELFYTSDEVAEIMSGLQPREATILRYHLYFDFAFMAGVYPAITALCMIVRQKAGASSAATILFIFAALQVVAWVLDIVENRYLLAWLNGRVSYIEFGVYHAAVIGKWLIALSGMLVVLFVLIRNRFYAKRAVKR